MRERLIERGPDQSGECLEHFNEYTLGLGHRRLSVIDLTETGRQPMRSANGRFIVVYNGEIYNHIELRDKLRRQHGIHFKGTSDTEVLVNCLEQWGIEDTLGELVGMFAFAAWDSVDGSLYLARDRMGEKPLYFGWQDKVFLFASDLKAMVAHPSMKPEVCNEAVSAFLRYGYIPSPLSIYEGVYKLEPGKYVKVVPGRISPGASPEMHSYWDANTYVSSKRDDIDIEEATLHVESLLRQSVRGQQISDVPLGVFLSGGVDSSLVAALAQQEFTGPVKTFTIGFEDKVYNEAEFAAAVASHIQSDHTELIVNKKHVVDLIPGLPDIYSEPFADSSQLPMCIISHLTRKHVTVSLSGDGGDELFFGYNRYRRINEQWRKFSGMSFRSLMTWLSQLSLVNACARVGERCSQRLASVARALPRFAPLAESRDVNTFYARAISTISPLELIVEKDFYNGMDYHYQSTAPDENISVFSRIDLQAYLPDDILVKVDRAAMHYSLETRAPLLDHRIVEYAVGLPVKVKCSGNRPKGLLRDILYRYVPEKLIERPKRGFAVPLSEWLRTDLAEWAHELLSERALEESGVGFKAKAIRGLYDRHMKGHNEFPRILWNILMFQAWHRSTWKGK